MSPKGASMKSFSMLSVVVIVLSSSLHGCCGGCGGCAEGCAEGFSEGMSESIQESASGGLATEQQCYDMLKNGTRLKAIDTGPFGDLSEDEQNAELDKIMAEDDMVTAVEDCQKEVTSSMAQCIADATSMTVYEACKYE
jgi:ferredoxin